MSYLIDPLHFCIALAPLAMYLFVIGVINLSSRPRAVTGAGDFLGLGLGLSGFVLIGPMELFLPPATAFLLGGWVWLLLLACYSLSLTLYVLLSRPRIVIYNLSAEHVRSLLVDVCSSLDNDVRWAGESVSLPALGVQLHLEVVSSLRNVQLISTSAIQSYDGWAQLHRRINARLRETSVPRNPYGLSLIFSAILIAATCSLWVMGERELVAQSFHELMRPGE